MPRSITIAAGNSNVQLPDGGAYDAGQTVTLTDEQFDQVRDELVGDVVIDNGPTARPGDTVYVQGTAVTAIANPAAATAPDVANKVNELLAALSGEGQALA